MIHLGDITQISGYEVPIVDIVTGGSPCQDLSVAGKRAGLEGERSGLFMEQIRIIKEMREHDKRNRGTDVDIRLLRPRYMVWENVPGAFSSNKGEDFRCVLEETAKIVDKDAVIPEPPKGKWSPSGCIMGDGWSIAWRVHDAQFWGVPQRRKRIALVADFGGQTAPEILFERKSVSGDSEQSEQEREEATGTIGASVDPSSYTLKIRGGVEVDSKGKKAGKGALIQTELSGTLGVSQDQTLITGCLNSWDVQSKHVQPESGIAEALYSGECRGGGGESYVMQGINGDVAGTLDSPYYKGCGERQGIERDVVYGLDQQGGKGGAAYTENVVPTIASDSHGTPHGVAYATQACGDRDNPSQSYLEDKAYTVPSNPMSDRGQAVVYGISAYDSNAMKSSNPHSGIYEADTSRTLDLNGGTPACNQGGMAVVQETDCDNTTRVFSEVADGLCAQDGRGGVHSQRLSRPEGNFVLEQVKDPQVICLEGNDSRPSHRGDGYAEGETMYTLNSTEHHAVCIGNGQADQLKESDIVGALNCMHDQQAVITYEIDRTTQEDKDLGAVCYSVDQGAGKSSASVDVEKSPTLSTTHDGAPAVCYGLDRASFNQGQNALFDFSVEEELAQPIVARGPGGVLSKQ